jgi:hypothetical protein
MTTSSTNDNTIFTRSARLSAHDGAPAGVCLVLTQSDLQSFGINTDDCERIYYRPQEVSVDGHKIRILRLIEPTEDTTIGN